MPLLTRPQGYYVVKTLLPKPRLTPDERLVGLPGMQERNQRAKRSRIKRWQARLLQGSPSNPSL